MRSTASDIARRLAENAEAVCRHYLSNGRREGQYWMIGDVRNTPGRSLYVLLAGNGDGGTPGKWTDAATGEHGDLLDIIAVSCGLAAFGDTLAEARRFLSLPRAPDGPRHPRPPKAPRGSPESARRLLAATEPMMGTLVEVYLAGRSITHFDPGDPLRFHPHCYYRASSDEAPGTRSAWPAMIAAVTDLAGMVTAVHRTWLDPETKDKAPIAYPRRAMGHLLGNGVRFGAPGMVMAAGEGLETMLSLRQAMPSLPMIAGLSGAHLAAVAFPDRLRRLYVARDDDPAGDAALARLGERAAERGIEVCPLEPRHGDFNGDLRTLGRSAMAASLRGQLMSADRMAYL